MTKIGEAKDQIMSWIQNNYYLEMQALLESEGYSCTAQEEAPWYKTDCPRSVAMGLHNQALTVVLDKLERNRSIGSISKAMLKGVLNKKYFSDRDIQKQVALEGSGAEAHADGH